MKVRNFIKGIITDSGKQVEGKTNVNRELSTVAMQADKKSNHD